MSTWPPRRPSPEPWWFRLAWAVGITVSVVVALLVAAGYLPVSVLLGE